MTAGDELAAAASSSDEAALDRLARILHDPAYEDLPLVVDFDETLFLRNSTEMFLDHAWPRPLAMALCRIVDLAKPWRAYRGPRPAHVFRDWLRVLTVTFLMPWTIVLWRRKARTLGHAFRNAELLRVIQQGGPRAVCVATLAATVVVAPLVKAAHPAATIIASGSLWRGFQLRKRGKLKSIRERSPEILAGGFLFVTDSEDDHDMLSASRASILHRWHDARTIVAFQNMYVPFLYTQKGKRPGLNYMWHNVLMEDIVLLALALYPAMDNIALGFVALAVLHLSFWAMYEHGYARNDLLGPKFETNPKLWPESEKYGATVRLLPALLFATVLGLIGAAITLHFEQSLLRPYLKPFGLTGLLGVWLGLLLATSALFEIYNRTASHARVPLYALLQLARTLLYGILFVVAPIGAALLTALALSRLVPYMTYRQSVEKLARNMRLLLLEFYLVLLAGVAVVDPAATITVQSAIVICWLIARAHRPLREQIRQFSVWTGRA